MNSDNDLLHEPHPINQKPNSALKSLKPLVFLTIVLLIVFVAATGGYLLGIRTNRNTSQSTQRVPFQPSPTIPSFTSTPSISPVSTTKAAGWKTYTDTEYGYQANYPQEFTFTSNQEGFDIVFRSKSVKISRLRKLFLNVNPDRKTVDTVWIIKNYDRLLSFYTTLPSSPNLTLEGIIVDGKSAVKITGKIHKIEIDYLDIMIVIPRGRDILEVNFNVSQDEFSRKPEIINNFISIFITTFRFLD